MHQNFLQPPSSPSRSPKKKQSVSYTSCVVSRRVWDQPNSQRKRFMGRSVMKLQWRKQNRTRNRLRMNSDTRMRQKSMTSHRQLGGKLLLRYVQNAYTNHRGIFLKSNNIQCLGNASMDSKHVWPRLNCSCTIWIVYSSCQSNLSKRGPSHNSLYNQ